MPSESDKWGWDHVSVFGGFDKGSGTKRWKCNHCNLRYNGSYSRVRAHLLGFSGVGVKSCPAIDSSLREGFQILEEERLDRKRKKHATSGGKPGKRTKTSQLAIAWKNISKKDVDDMVTRFFFADGVNVDLIESPYFLDMVKAIGAFGFEYEAPSVDELTDSLSREKCRIEKTVSLLRDSWPHTGCSIVCVAAPSDGGSGSSRASLFVSSPRGILFLKSADVDGSSDGTSPLIDALTEVIEEVVPANIVQVISHLDGVSKSYESSISSKFPSIIWSPCTRQSMETFMEEVSELEWVKPIISHGKAIEEGMGVYHGNSQPLSLLNLKDDSDPISTKLAPSYCFLKKISELREPSLEVIASEEWKQWKLSFGKDVSTIECSISGDSFWNKVQLLLQLYEPFVRGITSVDMDKSPPGAVCDWRIQAVEALRKDNKVSDQGLLNQLEGLIDTRWDTLFSPLHAAGYILDPRFFGKGQGKDKHVMRGWKTVLEKYQTDSNGRRILREQLSSYWRQEGSLGEEDAVDCRDKMDPVAWWENFGSETPDLQTLAIRVLSQVSSVGMCDEIWQTNGSSYQDVANRLGVQKAEDLFFVRNNLRLHSQRNGNLGGCASSSGPRTMLATLPSEVEDSMPINHEPAVEDVHDETVAGSS
ncbi:unnamed protein product [Linum tenue]|uniref:DUF659 domain-containing protein n=1 Tax=Linum tenue TaxID=586396 RepID=A0AAV0QGC8_9ROSI|nr:unnamed protein product [Linum tenue]